MNAPYRLSMDNVICSTSAGEYFAAPDCIRERELAPEVAVAPEPVGAGLPARLFRLRANAREVDAQVLGQLLTHLKGVSLPVHVYVDPACSMHRTDLVIPHKRPAWLEARHTKSLGGGLSVLLPEVQLLLNKRSQGVIQVAMRMFEATGIYAICSEAPLARLLLRKLVECGAVSRDMHADKRVYGYSDHRGLPLGFLDTEGEPLPWTACFDRFGNLTDMWKRPPITSCEHLARMLEEFRDLAKDRSSGFRDGVIAGRALRLVREGSASPAESKANLLLCAGWRYGGESWGSPDLNREIVYSEEARRIAGAAYCYGDAVWSGAKNVVEVDGYGFHADDLGFRIVTGRNAALRSMGYNVIELTTFQLADLEQLDALLPVYAEQLGFPLQKRTPAFLRRRDALHRELFGTRNNKK